MRKVKAECGQEMLAVIWCRIFCHPVCYPKIKDQDIQNYNFA